MSNAFAGLIKALSARVNVELAIEDSVRVKADFDNFALHIEHLAGGDQVLLAVSIAEVPAEGRQELYRELLQGQFLFGRTHGASLALDPAEEFICLQILQPILELTQDNFPDLVETFLNLAEFWRQRCLTVSESPAGRLADDQPSPAPADPGFLRA